ncbi:MAG TPA: alpha/beta fold hydrolase [Phototrophicaceae bacterium]|nr:alpha/beta fold hydrolase [Phototrophicaceae bacterium]
MPIHEGQPVHSAGTRLSEARAAMIMLHGRGSSAENILSLVSDLGHPEFAYLAPQAAGYSWYPQSFLAPLQQNEPYLSSALTAVAQVVRHVREALPTKQIMLLGFSQGGCLTLEFAARNAAAYGGVIGLSAGLIGPDGTARDYPGAFADTPIFLGCSDVDFHVPKVRVDQSAEVFRRMGANVTERIYPQMGHTINQDEIDFVKSLMDALIKA